MSAVVSDTSPLHYLVECDAVGILGPLFTEVFIPPAVHRELKHARAPIRVRDWASRLPSWVRIQAPLLVDPTLKVDEGEREAICLAREINAAAILIDDRKGRVEAMRFGLRVTGTIGLLEAAGRRGLLDFPTAVARLRQTNARQDGMVIEAALARWRGK